MIVELEEMKGYLRVDFDDDDELIKYFIVTGENLCADIARISVEELSEIPSSKIAVMYAVAAEERCSDGYCTHECSYHFSEK